MKTILFVDDEPAILSTLRRMLHSFRDEWTLLFATNGRDALATLETNHVDAVVTDVNMPGMDGLELLSRIASGAFGFVPVVVVTGKLERHLKRQAIDLGAQDLLSKPVNHEDLIARLRSVLAIKAFQDELNKQNSLLEELVAERTAELAASRLELVIKLSKAAELHDVDTGDHVLRVGMFSRALGIEMGFTGNEADELFLAATLHDIGKVAIPDSILRKQGGLDPFEREIMESHCVFGYRILTERDSSLGTLLPASMRVESRPPCVLSLAGNIARLHHERWDGTGYPDGLCGPFIPLPARIVAVADALDALRSRRPYKEPLDWESSKERILASSGSHFDPAVCEAFVRAETALMEIDFNMRTYEIGVDLEVAA